MYSRAEHPCPPCLQGALTTTGSLLSTSGGERSGKQTKQSKLAPARSYRHEPKPTKIWALLAYSTWPGARVALTFFRIAAALGLRPRSALHVQLAFTCSFEGGWTCCFRTWTCTGLLQGRLTKCLPGHENVINAGNFLYAGAFVKESPGHVGLIERSQERQVSCQRHELSAESRSYRMRTRRTGLCQPFGSTLKKPRAHCLHHGRQRLRELPFLDLVEGHPDRIVLATSKKSCGFRAWGFLKILR